MNYIGACLRRLCQTVTTRKKFAERCGVSYSYINNIVVAGKPVGTGLLPRFCAEWDSPQDRYEVVRAYLLDEIVRTGQPVEAFEIRIRDHARDDDRLGEDLDLLERLTGEQSMREKIHFMAELARQNIRPNGDSPLSDAVDDCPPVDGAIKGIGKEVLESKASRKTRSRIA
jgi:hypothetical protein